MEKIVRTCLSRFFGVCVQKLKLYNHPRQFGTFPDQPKRSIKIARRNTGQRVDTFCRFKYAF